MRQNITRVRAGISALLLVSSGVLCSCDSLHYTEEQEDKISNYAAQIVLKHDKKYKYSFLPAINDEGGSYEQEVQEETDEIISTEEATTVTTDYTGENTTSEYSGDGNSSGTGITDINQAIHIGDGINISYTGYDVVSTYPTDDSEETFVIKAVGDSTLLIVKFDVKNTTSQDINVNFMENGRRNKGIVNESKKYNAQLTLLLDAMNTFEGTIGAGQSRQLVLIFQTQLGSTADLSKLSVSVTDESGEENIIDLK